MEDLQLYFPIQKVDKTQRVVIGVATANNVDPAGDLVEFQASRKAFKNWMGNIREMHQPKAVGKKVSYRTVKVPHEGQVYDGIEVTAYISKGAEDTWQKVLDNTLRGFSIGGTVHESEYRDDPATGRRIKVIKDYDLGELSLVDNPGNPLGLLSIIKRADDGMLEYALEKYDVFFCKKDKIASTETNICQTCGDDMDLVGSVEDKSVDIVRKMMLDNFDALTVDIGPEREEKLLNNNNDDIVSSMELTTEQEEGIMSKLRKVLFGQPETSNESSTTMTMTGFGNTATATTPTVHYNFYTNDSVTKSADVAIAPESEEITKAEDSSESVTEEVEGGNEVDLEKLMESMGALLDSKLSAVKEEIAKSVDEKIDAKVEQIQKSVDEISIKAEDASAKAETASEQVEKVAESGAVKQSVDATDEEERIEKSESVSFWGGLFVPPALCNALGYES